MYTTSTTYILYASYSETVRIHNIVRNYTFSGLCHDVPPFAPLSRQEIIKLQNYRILWVQTSGEKAVNISCRYSNYRAL